MRLRGGVSEASANEVGEHGDTLLFLLRAAIPSTCVPKCSLASAVDSKADSWPPYRLFRVAAPRRAFFMEVKVTG